MIFNNNNRQAVFSEEETSVFAEQTRLLYQALPLSLLTVLTISLIVAYVLLSVIDAASIVLWLFIITVISSLRIWLYLAFRRTAPEDAAIRPWAQLFFLGTLFSGISWGLAVWLLFPSGDVIHQVFLALALAGMTAGAVTSLSAQIPGAMAFLLLTIFPLILRFFVEGTDINQAMGLMTIIYLIMVVASTWRSHKTIRESLKLRFAQSQTEAALEESAEHNHLILDSAAEGIFGVDTKGITTFVNPAGARMLGYEINELIGRPMHQTIHHSYADGSHYPVHDCPMHAAIKEGYCQHIDEEVLWRKDGSCFSVDYITTPIMKEDIIQGAVVTFRDTTERKKVKAQIEYQAYYDGLTDLPNRRLLLNQLEQNLARCKHHGHIGAILFLDLDRFKAVNDSLGHKVGDALLKSVAERLSSGLSTEDTAARLSGDEFVVLLSEVSDELETAEIQVRSFAERIQSILSQPYDIEGRLLHITPSIGITLFPMGNEDTETILREADIAMYRAKEKGRNAIQFYLPSMQQDANEKLLLENDLRQAMARDELLLHCQPQTNAEGIIHGAEVLIRWQHPMRGLIPPGDFIPLAEDTGLILPIGEWVLLTACRQLKVWSDESIDCTRLTISVNVSPRQFRQKSFVQQIQAILEETGANPACLELEITEGLVIADVEDTIEKMLALQEIGVRFALDDFGTGYSSLNYLKRLPLNKLKIDQSFVRDITTDPNNAAIIETIIAMASHLKLGVIAEGVESEEQLQFLQQQGCHSFQGHHFYRPMSFDAYRKTLREQTGLSVRQIGI